MDELEARIEALERAVTDGDHDLSELATEGETRDRLATVETELGELADRVAELEAATQALRGYVGNVRAVNRDVEQRADAALAKAESLESAIAGDQPGERSDHDPAGGTDTTLNATATTEDRQQTAETPDGGGASTTADGRATEPGGHGHATTDRHVRCETCGQPTDSDAHGSGRGTAASKERADATATGAGPSEAAGGIGPGSPANGASTGEAGDPLDGVFETAERTNGDEGAFDRIRQML